MKTRLEFGLKPCNYDIKKTHSYSDKSTQYEIFNHKVSIGDQVERVLQEKAEDVLSTSTEDVKTQQPQPQSFSSQNLRMPCAVFSFKGTASKKKNVTMSTNKWLNGKTIINRSYLQKYRGKAWMTMTDSGYKQT